MCFIEERHVKEEGAIHDLCPDKLSINWKYLRVTDLQGLETSPMPLGHHVQGPYFGHYIVLWIGIWKFLGRGGAGVG